MKRGKKGSHVGVMLSFGIFVVFLVFLYSVLQPIIRLEQDKKLILNDLIVEFIGRFDTVYTSGSIKTTNSDFLTEMNGFASDYDNDYAGLKEDLKISEGNEFGFVFVDVEDVEIAPETDVPESVNVYAKKIPVYYTGEETVLLGFITLKVW